MSLNEINVYMASAFITLTVTATYLALLVAMGLTNECIFRYIDLFHFAIGE